MKKFLSMVLALVMTMSLVTISAGAKDFTDDSKITYKEAVDVVSAIGIVDGYEDGAFNPTNNLTRGAAAKIICNLILGPTTASALSADTAPFKDVPVTNDFAGYIAYCAQQGIISGYADGTFRPAGTLTGYAFMKMLLGALGYNAENEGYVGSNWSVQVGKQALGIGLDDGNDDFVGTEAVNREEACLYAFNTLKATMVEYENQSQIVIGDITVNTSSKAKEMENTGKSDTYINENGKMEFAEKYFTDLRLRGGEDAFARPANVWSLKSVEIGTYAKTPDATYTAKVENGNVYKDLGLGSTMDKADVTVYVNGEEKEDLSLPLRKSGDTKVGESANGVLTEVFYNKDDGSAIVTQVKTYVGEISKSVEATDKRDAYVEVITSVNTGVPPTGAAGTEKFETNEEFDDEAYVLYTFSIPEDEIQSVALAEEVTGTVSKVVNKSNDSDNSKVTIDGTEYKASATMAPDLLKNISVDMDYTAYLDAYGYVITVDEEDYSDYALVLEIESSDDAGFKSDRAKLVLTDGTVKVVTLDKDYKNKGIDQYDIVTFKAKDNNDYVLKEVKASAYGKVDKSASFDLKNERASITTETGTTVYGNSKTMFVVKNVTGKDYSAYTGVKSVPSVKAQDLNNSNGGTPDADTEKVTAYWYCKSGSIATVMFVLPGSDALSTNESNNLLFLAKESASDLIHDADGDYYEYQAVVNGEVKTVKVDWEVKLDGVAQSHANAGKLNGLFSRYNVNDDIITGVTTYDTTPDPDKKFAGFGTGTNRNTGDYTVRIVSGTNAGTWTVADNAKFYEVDKKGNVSTGAYSSVVKDDDDRAYFVIDGGAIIYMFVEEVDSKYNAQPATSVTITADPAATVVVDDTLTLTVSDVVLADSKNDSVSGYQWYKDNAVNTEQTTLADVLDDTKTTKIAGATGKSYKVPTDTAEATGTYYYCVVETYNDKVDGKDTAQAFEAVKVTINPTPDETMNVTINRYNVNGNVLLATETKAMTETEVAAIAAPPVANYTATGATTTSVTFVSGGSATVSFYYKADLMSIEVTTAPTATTETGASSVVKTGMVVTGTYADGSTADVTAGCTITADTSTAGTVEATVTHTASGKTATCNITVQDP